MGDAMAHDGLKSGIGQHDLQPIGGRRIAFKNDLKIPS
jgi:hypothetical protein